LKTGLQLKLAQHLTLTPQLQQSIRLLQLSTLELQQEISTALAENPLLELEDAEHPPETSIESLAVADRSLERDGPIESDLFAVIERDHSSFEQSDSSFDAARLNGGADAVVTASSNEATEDIGASLAAALDGRTDDDGVNDSARDALDFEQWGSGASGGDGDDSFEWQQSRHRDLRAHLLEQLPLLREGEAINALLHTRGNCGARAYDARRARRRLAVCRFAVAKPRSKRRRRAGFTRVFVAATQ
jgi:DNA-directed RNA polymerase specialized sigma54-like protein